MSLVTNCKTTTFLKKIIKKSHGKENETKEHRKLYTSAHFEAIIYMINGSQQLKTLTVYLIIDISMIGRTVRML